MYDDIDAIARQIKNGNLELLPNLWDKVSRFIHSKAAAWLAYNNTTIIEVDDLVNECYFVLLPAIEAWNPDKAKYLTYYNYYLPNCFQKAYYGGRSNKNKLDPINNHASLDAPLKTEADDEITLLDTIVDINADAFIRNLEDYDFWESVSAFLHKCIIQVDDEIGRTCMLYMLDNQYDSLSLVGSKLYPEHSCDSIRHHYNKARFQLKRILYHRLNKEEAKRICLDYEIYGGGFNRFVLNNYTSNIEDAVIRSVDKERYRNDMYDLLIHPDCKRASYKHSKQEKTY